MPTREKPTGHRIVWAVLPKDSATMTSSQGTPQISHGFQPELRRSLRRASAVSVMANKAYAHQMQEPTLQEQI